MTSTDDFILQLAVDQGLLSRECLEAARVRGSAPGATEGGTSVLELLFNARELCPRRVSQLLAEHFGLPVLDHLCDQRPNRDLIARVPRHLATQHRVFPLEQRGQILRVAVHDPLDSKNLEELSTTLRLTLELVVAPWSEIQAALDRCYSHFEEGVNEDRDGSGAAYGRSRIPMELPEMEEQFSEQRDAPIMTLVWTILNDAIQCGASDIHLEPMATRFRVRNRVDGVLQEAAPVSVRLQSAVVSRIKIMANLSIAEKRLPQDGRVRLEVAQKWVDLRVSSLPTAHGESVVIRILDKESLKIGLPELGFCPDDLRACERLIGLPDGMILVTGPTGSGKTTTLYNILYALNRRDRKIVTVEDPVEYQLSGINQVAVRSEVGMTFANALRAILRQSPNTVMVGEIRDRETAEIATHAALTGHLVFSTLHTNDAAGAITRLLDLGVKPFLVASSLRAVMAQRLVRKVCTACGRPHSPTPCELRSLRIEASAKPCFTLLKGAGCPVCNGTGYKGRVAIIELLVLNEEMQNAIHQRSGVEVIRKLARVQGARTLREDGLRKVISGITTLDEVFSNTVNDNA